MWGLGEFVTLSGAILQNVLIAKFVPPSIPFVGYGLDFGFADDPATLMSIWRTREDLYLNQEIYGQGYTNQALGNRMEEINVSRSSRIIADSAEPKSIRELRDMGFHVISSAKGWDYKHYAAQWLQSFKHIYIIEGSTEAYREFTGWSWALDRKGNKMPQPADGDDHTVDATIYGAYKKVKRWLGI